MLYVKTVVLGLAIALVIFAHSIIALFVTAIVKTFDLAYPPDEPPVAPERVCKTCAHVIGLQVCGAPQAAIDYVSGNHVTPCYKHREAGRLSARFESLCGREGRWWKMKPGSN